ncbi:LysR family transcriptional regulator [Thalassotalea piscium]|uniref:DNA-binding transcriptional LysR family regulator n=1 Tax=Thalassotalea piscium TaxID=1230533 RepID=A0A7X0TS29_9GAMM|nr:LysR family transcriptional regulator [Thalassotalea piscium]MBB6541635.1 DNA-binding transcriptional LysR family regulator [Thalassotalea piscium]
MDLRSLKYFVAVVEQQSFSGAAKACFIAQPSISAAISQLELELKQTLFIRHTRGVKITEQGEKLYPLATKLLGQADAIKQSFIRKQDKTTFLLGVTRGLGVKRMSALLKDFTASQPTMELTLVPHQEDANARIVLKEELRGDEKYLSLWQEDYVLALPSNHPLSLIDKISISHLHQIAAIERSPCLAWQALNETLALSGIELDIRAKIQTIDYAIGLVKAGLGCALVPVHPEVLEHKDIVLKPIEGIKLTREIVLAYEEESNIVNSLTIIAQQHQHTE